VLDGAGKTCELGILKLNNMALKKAILEEVSGIEPDLSQFAETTQTFEREIESDEITFQIDITYRLLFVTEIDDFRGVYTEKRLEVKDRQINTRIVDNTSGDYIFDGECEWIDELIQNKIF